MNVRNTVQKSIIKEKICTLKFHPSAEEVYCSINKEHPSISRATVYRNLNNMADSGEISRITMLDSSDRYDFKTDKHYHLQCVKCGKVFDSDLPYMASLDQNQNKHAKILSHGIVFKCVCSDCQS